MPVHLFQAFFPAEALELALFGLAQGRHAAGSPEAAEAALGNGLGELLEHLEGLQQPVHIRHLQAAAGGNALFAAGIEDGGVLPLQRGHGLDDGPGAAQLLFVQVSGVQLLAHVAGQHPGQLAQVAHFCSWSICSM